MIEHNENCDTVLTPSDILAGITAKPCNCPAASPPSLDAPAEQINSSSTPIRDDQEVAASPLINGENHGRASSPLKWLSAHGCLTGDCPHDTQSECDKSLADAYRELAKEYE